MNLELKKDLLGLKEAYQATKNKLLQLRKTSTILPDNKDLLNFIKNIKLFDIKVVIIGQEPYTTYELNDGLAFSASKSTIIPETLLNIYKELNRDLSIKVDNTSSLSSWSTQGVVLLNKILTVEQGIPKSHFKIIGWEEFTEKFVSIVSKHVDNVVFMLWGTEAKKLKRSIDKDRHLILTAASPSPLSASRGFFGCGHFSKANAYLSRTGRGEIKWENLVKQGGAKISRINGFLVYC